MSDLYMPIEERRTVIRNYAVGYGCRTFVETGTADGSTTEALIPDFDLLYTIEIDPGLYNHAVLMFEPYSNVFPMLGDSSEVLPRVLELLHSYHPDPAIFWLDGHYCGGATRGPVDSPVINELEAIFDKAPKGSVVLIDDARIFGGGEEEGLEGYTGYPDLWWVSAQAGSYGYDYANQKDIIRLTPSGYSGGDV